MKPPVFQFLSVEKLETWIVDTERVRLEMISSHEYISFEELDANIRAVKQISRHITRAKRILKNKCPFD
jgi:predicted transcriptional regulator